MFVWLKTALLLVSILFDFLDFIPFSLHHNICLFSKTFLSIPFRFVHLPFAPFIITIIEPNFKQQHPLTILYSFRFGLWQKKSKTFEKWDKPFKCKKLENDVVHFLYSLFACTLCLIKKCVDHMICSYSHSLHFIFRLRLALLLSLSFLMPVLLPLPSLLRWTWSMSFWCENCFCQCVIMFIWFT